MEALQKLVEEGHRTLDREQAALGAEKPKPTDFADRLEAIWDRRRNLRAHENVMDNRLRHFALVAQASGPHLVSDAASSELRPSQAHERPSRARRDMETRAQGRQNAALQRATDEALGWWARWRKTLVRAVLASIGIVLAAYLLKTLGLK